MMKANLDPDNYAEVVASVCQDAVYMVLGVCCMLTRSRNDHVKSILAVAWEGMISGSMQLQWWLFTISQASAQGITTKVPIENTPQLCSFYADWTKHEMRTRNISSRSSASMVLALPSGQKSETKPRQRKSASASRIQSFSSKRSLAKEKETTTNQDGGLSLSDTLGAFLRAVALKKESEGTGDSKAKSRKEAVSTKIDELCNDPKGEQEPHLLKVDAKRRSRDGDSHRTLSTEHTESLSGAASKVKRKILEYLLSKVEQTPSESMLEALRPSFNVVLIDEVLRNSNLDVKISVAYCFSEIMRITALKEPFNDDQMKEFFDLTVMSFQKLSSASGSNYSKISTFLRIFSHFRLCVLILDLELNELVVQMFQHFFNVVGSNISDSLRDIQNIMTMVIEESEVFPYELLSLLISSVKNENQCASPWSWKLGEEVLKKCAAILKPCLPEVVKRMGIDLNDYAKTVASICQDEFIEEANECALVAISSGEVTPSVNEPLMLLTDDSAQMRKDEAMNVKDSQATLSRCHQAAKPKSAGADESIEASAKKPLGLGYTDSTSRGRPIKPNPKYEEGYNSGLVVFTPDWTKRGKRTRNNSSKSSDSMVLALPSGQKSETKPRQRKSASASGIQRLSSKRRPEKEKETTTDQDGGLSLLSDTLGDFLRAQAEEKASQRKAVTLKKESEGSGDSKAKRRKLAVRAKTDDPNKQQEPDLLKVEAKRSRDGDSHRTQSTEHTDSLSDAASKAKRKKRTPLNEEGTASCVEKHGDKLIGCKIKVWWPMDEMFYEGVITSFDQSTKKHEVTYLDDEVEVLDLKSERWELVSDQEQGIAANSSANTLYEDQTYSCSTPKKRQKGELTDSLITDVSGKKHGMHPPSLLLPQADSSSQTNSSISRGKEGEKQLALVALPIESVPSSSSQQLALTTLETVDVQGYKVKPCNALILEAIFAKHGDIAADCKFKSASVRASFLEIICEVVKKIQNNDFAAIFPEIETWESEIADTHAAKVNVSWLQDYLERYERFKEAVERFCSLKDAKVNTELVSKAANREVEERRAELAAAEKCAKGLEFVTKKINSDLLESETEESYWRREIEKDLL